MESCCPREAEEGSFQLGCSNSWEGGLYTATADEQMAPKEEYRFGAKQRAQAPLHTSRSSWSSQAAPNNTFSLLADTSDMVSCGHFHFEDKLEVLRSMSYSAMTRVLVSRVSRELRTDQSFCTNLQTTEIAVTSIVMP
jgi:hypothetical protein